MSIAATNVKVSDVANEIGSASRSVSILVGISGLNRYSLYAPGTLGPDANKDLILTPPSTNFKLGDYRLYDHSAVEPTWVDPPSGFLYYGPGSLATPTLPIAMNWLNIASSSVASEIIDSTTTPWHYHVKVDVYNTDGARTTGTSPVKSWILGIDMNTVETGFTILSGHSRNMSGKAIMNTGSSGNLFVLDDVAVSGTCTRYFEAYFCDIAGNRELNFGTRGTGYPGYQDIEFRENAQPVVYSGYNFNVMGQSNPADISGVSWTFAAPFINDDTVVCSYETSIQMTQGSGTTTFYVKVYGVCATPNPGSTWVAGVTTCDILLDYGPTGTDYTDTLATGVAIVANSAGYQINTTLSGGRTWQYNWTGRIRLANTTFSGTNYNCS